MARRSIFEIFPENPQAAIEPTPSDVLCGQPKTFVNHPGNIAYNQVIAAESVNYMTPSNSKNFKMEKTKEIVEQVKRSGGRFLALGPAAKWEVLTDNKARDKVSHALREYFKKHYKGADDGKNKNNRTITPPSHIRMVSNNSIPPPDEQVDDDDDTWLCTVDDLENLLKQSGNTFNSMDFALFDSLRSRSSLGDTLRSRDVTRLLHMDVADWESVQGWEQFCHQHDSLTVNSVQQLLLHCGTAAGSPSSLVRDDVIMEDV